MPISDIPRAVENRFRRDIIPVLRRHGWRPRIVPYDGYGSSVHPLEDGPQAAGGARHGPATGGTPDGPDSTPGVTPDDPGRRSTGTPPSDMARVLARVVMRDPGAPAEGPLFRSLPGNMAEARDLALTSLLEVQRGWRLFIDLPVPFIPVTVTLGAASVRTRADRSGCVDVVLRGHGLPPGWHQATIQAAGSTVTAAVLVVAPGPRLGVIADVDDTVMITHIPRALLATWNSMVKYTSARQPVPGMARMLTDVQTAHPGAPVFYVSTGAWNVLPTLRAFFERHGFPAGPKLLTAWGPTNTGWFRSGIEHKRTQFRRLLIDLPEVVWLLVGDDGQHDLLLYGELAREHRNRVAAIAIRQLTPAQQVLAGSLSAHPLGQGPEAQILDEAEVPVVFGDNGYELACLLPPEILPG